MLLKYDKCKEKSCRECCDEYRDQPYGCFLYDEIIKERDRNSHINKHYKTLDLHRTCNLCKIYKHISYFR